MEYIADDCPSSGNPLLMLVSWGTHARNAKANPNVTLTMRDATWYHAPRDEKDRGAMDHARITLAGQLRVVPANHV